MASQAFLSAEAAATTSVTVASSPASHSPFSASVKGTSSAGPSSSSSSSSSSPSSSSSSSCRKGQHGLVSKLDSSSDPWGPHHRRLKVGGDVRPPAGGSLLAGRHLSNDRADVRVPAGALSIGHLSNDFCGHRSTRQVSKLHFGRPKLHNGKHSAGAKLALQEVLQAHDVSHVLDMWSPKLYLHEDSVYLLRELGNAGEASKVAAAYEWTLTQETLKNEWSKLLSISISALGRLGQVNLAQEIFERAVSAGFGRSVYAYSALVSAYGRSGRCNKALEVFEAMKRCGCKPNLITYNAVIDACGKGGIEYKKALKFFEEMEREGVEPDRITFNSLIAVCSRGNLWEEAQRTFEEMQRRGIDQDIFTYNTVVDAVCKAGKMDHAAEIVSRMQRNSVKPNVVTYSTLLDGYGKSGRFSEAIAVYEEMKDANIVPDRVSYNTLVYIYAKLGKFDEALLVCGQMEKAGWKKDAVTYNALLDAYGKQGQFDEAMKLFKKMKAKGIVPSVLTYSTLMDAYSKGGFHKEALDVFKEFKAAGMKPDVVLYSSLIDALCKTGLVDDATNLLKEMIREGIRPNVVTFNSIIDAYGRNPQIQLDDGSISAASLDTMDTKVSDASREGSECFCDVTGLSLKEEEDESFGNDLVLSDQIPTRRTHRDILAAIRVFQEMWRLGVKPNVVTFSAILHACSRCASFMEAASLLEGLCKFDNKVYGVAHGLLLGSRKHVWGLAGVLFDEVARLDQSTAAAFYNALADVLWHFGQREGAQKVVMEALRRSVWVHAWQRSCLDLHLMSVGAAQAMLHSWLLNIRSIVFEGRELPKLLSILTGWGRHSKVAGESIVKKAVESHLLAIGAPFQVAKYNEGRLISTGHVVGEWLLKVGTLELLILQDARDGSAEIRDQCREKQLVLT